jgi:hypothetical protein
VSKEKNFLQFSGKKEWEIEVKIRLFDGLGILTGVWSSGCPIFIILCPPAYYLLM